MIRVLSILAALVLAASTCWGAAFVTVEDGSFTPNWVTVLVNDTVRWTWDSFNSLDYAVVSDPGQDESWASAELAPGSTYEHTFTHVGAFTYYGTYMGGFKVQGMQGSVEVLDVPEPAVLPALGSFIVAALGCLIRRKRL
ncbi:MAG: hypothetical protein HYX78_14090 [Armatimonadetes bacterium]|nr:hypothetical protein [Armatimonadota bacterium]